MRNLPAATTLLEPGQLARVRARSNLWGIYLVCHAWVVIGAAMALVVVWPNPLTYLLAVGLIGSRQLGLLILMHDAAHNALARSPRVNRVLAQWFCAFPLLADTDIYRRYHLKHHARTLRSDDPDIVLTGHYPITRASLKRKLLRDITGQTGYSQRRTQLRAALGERDWPLTRRLVHFWRGLGRQLLANLVLLSAFSLAGHWYLYLLLWLVPLLTWQQLVLRVRNIAEHAVVRAAEDVFGNARTTIANVAERIFVAPYWVNYHLEHHLIMWVPCYRLPLLRELLVANGYGAQMETEFGYLDVLKRVTVDAADVGSGGGGARERATGTFSSGYGT